jgi:hypothetical protein
MIQTRVCLSVDLSIVLERSWIKARGRAASSVQVRRSLDPVPTTIQQQVADTTQQNALVKGRNNASVMLEAIVDSIILLSPVDQVI